VRNELLSAERAETEYGVVIDTGNWTVDPAATEARRAAIAEARGWREAPKVLREEPSPAKNAAEQPA